MQAVKLTRRQPQWYMLKSSRKGGKKKDSSVSGEIQLQFALVDSVNPSAAPRETFQKLMRLIAGSNVEDEEGCEEALVAKTQSNDDDDDDEDEDDAADTSEETDDATKPEVAEKRKRKLRLKRLRKKSKARTYEFSGAGGVVLGITFVEIVKAVDLPPERNGAFILCICRRTHRLLIFTSDSNILRYGPLCGGFAGTEDVQNPRRSSQPQSRVRRETSFPSYAP